jgi:hypothetical protein
LSCSTRPEVALSFCQPGELWALSPLLPQRPPSHQQPLQQGKGPEALAGRAPGGWLRFGWLAAPRRGPARAQAQAQARCLLVCRVDLDKVAVEGGGGPAPPQPEGYLIVPRADAVRLACIQLAAAMSARADFMQVCC